MVKIKVEKVVSGVRAEQPQAQLRLLKTSLQPTPSSLDELRGAIETWEAEYPRCIGRVDEPLSDSVRGSTLQPMCPLSLSGHLDLHAARLGMHALRRAEIDAYSDVKKWLPAPQEQCPWMWLVSTTTRAKAKVIAKDRTRVGRVHIPQPLCWEQIRCAGIASED